MSKEETIEEFTAAYKEENPGASDEDIQAAYDAKQAEGLNLTEKVIKVMDDYGTMLMSQMKASLEKQMAEVVAATQDELVAAIRKGVGLDEDPVVHLSEVSSYVRKILLEKEAGDGKKTGDDAGAGPGGAQPLGDSKTPAFDIEKRFEELNKGRFG